MPFALGDRVHLAGLGTGRVIELRGADRYAIEIKGRVVIAAGRDLEIADPDLISNARNPNAVDRASIRATRARSAGVIDLHGKTVQEALEAVEAFINEALVNGRAEVEIIHGRGGGRVKTAVHRYLRQLSVVAGFRLAPHNAGVTIVTFS